MPDAEAGLQRRCLLTGQRTAPDRLIRFAVDATDAVVPDPERRMPGRGLWLLPAVDAVATAVAKGLFARGARRKVQVAADLAVRTRQTWTAHAAAQVARARRAGLVLADAAAAGRTDVLTADAAAIGFGRLALRRTPFTRRLAADLALLAALGPVDG